jgi:hypothetical protein
MRSQVLNEKEWIPLKEASEITGRSMHALRLLIHRGRIEKVRKQQVNGHGYWEIHRDVLSVIRSEKATSQSTTQQASQICSHENIPGASQAITMPAEIYIQQQKERDSYLQGMMMYRYKFEELDRQVKLLPAPVDQVAMKLQEAEHKDQVLRDAQEAITRLEEDLRRERFLPWWKKIFRNR